jgi:tRNA A-37 threonylcarbamoyl transferase component Bud32/ABC-type Fe3+ transport system substrate-binding protein
VEAHDPMIGTVVGGRYQVVRLIARGGMGNVYEVRHQRVNRTFALKTLARELLTDPSSLARFRREADVVAGFRHPNIVEIVDWEHLPDGSPCIVMEYMRGEELAQLIARQGPLPWPQIAMIADQVLSALGVAHRAGIVHRDLKPQNIFLVYDDAGEVHAKLLDFGVSKIRGHHTMGSGADLIGTPSYMSPEQAQARSGDVGPEADVWAMGAILHEMATGRMAFEAPNVPAILYRVTHGEPESLRAYRPDAPPGFEALVYQTISRDPRARLADVHALRMGLREALADVSPGMRSSLAMMTPPAGSPRPGQPSTLGAAASQMVSVHGQPQSSRRGLFIGLGMLVALGAAAAIALVVLGGGDGKDHAAATTTTAGPETTEITVAYSSEKKDWMEAATAAFAKKHPEISVKLSKIGSLEAGEAIIAGKEKPVLWSPADSVVLNLFGAEWKATHPKELFVTAGEDAPQPLLLTPVVWIAWEDRAQSLGPLSWHVIHDAVVKDHLKLGHTDPTRSSTGLLALLSMATEFYVQRPLDEGAVADAAFIAWLAQLEAGIAKKDEASTGAFASHMIEYGPSQVEVGVVYESIAITMFDKAKQRWNKGLHVEYPAVTFWSDHPIALLAGDWVKPEQAKAAHAFVAFLRSREIQQTALQFGFRAADLDVPLMTDDPNNPFKKFAANGIKLEIPAARAAPPSAVARALLDDWKRITSSR